MVDVQGQGWIKFHRKILENEIWRDITTFRLFTLLLLKASHRDGVKINGIELKRGQYIRSYSKLVEDLEYKEKRGYKRVSKSTILRSIKKLVSEGIVSINETDNGTLFTILKYQEYQWFDSDSEKLNETVNEPLSKRNRNDIETKTIIKELKNAEEYINTSCRKSKTYDQVSVHYQLALRLLNRIKENFPGYKEPNLQKWSNDIRLMMERDNRTEKQVAYLIDWCQQDSFWKSNILSPSKLREKFDQLAIKVKSDKSKQSGEQQKKLISTERPAHLKEPEVTEEMNRQIEEALMEMPY